MPVFLRLSTDTFYQVLADTIPIFSPYSRVCVFFFFLTASDSHDVNQKTFLWSQLTYVQAGCGTVSRRVHYNFQPGSGAFQCRTL